MYVVAPVLNAAVSTWRAAAFLALSFLTNFAGAVSLALMIAYLGEYTHRGPVHDYVLHNAEHKCELGWGVAVLRGVGANWLVCLGMYQAWSCTDIVSKMASIWLPVFAFVAIGFEHSVANMYYVNIGLFEGAHATFGEFIVKNLIPVTLGNMLGGGVLLGLVQWLTYDETRSAKQGEFASFNEAPRAEAGTAAGYSSTSHDAVKAKQ